MIESDTARSQDEPPQDPKAETPIEIKPEPTRPKTTVVQVTQSNPAWEDY